MYARADNFTGRVLYDSLSHAYLHPDAARALAQAAKELRRQRPDLRFLIKDAARPVSVQRHMFRTVRGTPKARYVANPANGGGTHNFGIAVDITLCDTLGRELPMGTPSTISDRSQYRPRTGTVAPRHHHKRGARQPSLAAARHAVGRLQDHSQRMVALRAAATGRGTAALQTYRLLGPDTDGKNLPNITVWAFFSLKMVKCVFFCHLNLHNSAASYIFASCFHGIDLRLTDW